MPRLKFRLACCLCGKCIPLACDVYTLDAEWQRRFPQLIGTLACACAVSTAATLRGTSPAVTTTPRATSARTPRTSPQS
ncbi:hypothetical protein AB0K48_25710 [Nonomuraea sp. NPDC055795]